MAIVSIDKNPATSEVIFRVDSDDFGSFVRDIISQNKTITKNINGHFVIDKAFTLDLIELISHRVKLQNKILMSSFSAKTYYDDGYEQTVESLNAYEAIRDARQQGICALQLNMVYLLVFPGRQLPEKQSISVIFRTEKYNKRTLSHGISLFFFAPIFSSITKSEIDIIIDYTDVSWGLDIETLIARHLSSRILLRSDFFETFRQNIGFFSMFGLLCGLPGYTVFAYERLTHLNKHQIFEQLKNNDFFDRVAKTLEIMVDPPPIRLDQVYQLVAQFAFMFLALAAITYLSILRQPSFINNNAYTANLHEKYYKKYDFVKYGVILTFVVSVLASVFASYIYDHIKVAF